MHTPILCTYARYQRANIVWLALGARLTPVKSTGRRSQPQSQPGCRTTHAKKLRPLDSSAAGFSTFRTLLAFYRSHNPPYQILVEVLVEAGTCASRFFDPLLSTALLTRSSRDRFGCPRPCPHSYLR